MVSGLLSGRARALSGRIRVPGDKSISHRALILGSLAVGTTEILGLLEADDVMRTVGALRALGVEIRQGGDGKSGSCWTVYGVGVGGLAEAAVPLDLGNAGTGVRLLMGVAAGHPFVTFFTGDASLSARPMSRVAEPLEAMGAKVLARSGGRLPLAVIGTESPLPIVHRLAIPSAQVKSAILLAGLSAPGETMVIESQPSRDHTEIMLCQLGAELRVEERQDGARAIALLGQAELAGRALRVPGDFSSAAFPLAAALLVPGSELTIEEVGVNPLRLGFLETLSEMGAKVRLVRRRSAAGEEVADIEVRAAPLSGVEVPPERAPRMIDEYPILGVLAACAEGRTVMRGLGELRVKESDRVAAMARGLKACGARVTEFEDGLIVEGLAAPPKGGAEIEARLDHRIAMAFLVLGMIAEKPVRVDDGAVIDTSFPGFVELMNGLGADIAEA